MLINYNAKKGIKLYGDEVFCMSPTEVLSPRNLLLNGDLKYGLYGWVGSDSLYPLAIENGLLKVPGDTGHYARQRVEVVNGQAYYFRLTSVYGNTPNTQFRILDGTTLTVIYDSGVVPAGHTYGSWFVATSGNVYFELIIPSGYGSIAYNYFKDMMLADFQSTGVPAINLVSNSYFPDTVGWTAEGSALISAGGAELTIENGSNPYGAELHTFANAASFTEANATIGFTNVGCDVFQSQSVIVSSGTYAMEVSSTSSPTQYNRMYLDLDLAPFSLVAGQMYTLSFDVRHVGSGGAWATLLSNTTSGSDPSSSYIFAGVVSTDLTFTNYTINFKHNANTRYLVWRETSGTFNGGVFVDALSIKESAEIVPNGTFHMGTSFIDYWTLSAGVTVSAGALAFNSASFMSANSDNATIVGGVTYQISYEVMAYTSGGINLHIGDAFITLNSTIGVHTVYLTTTTLVSYTGVVLDSVAAVMTIDNLSIVASGAASTIITVSAGLVYKLHYKHIRILGTNVNIAVGTVGSRDAYGGTTVLAASKSGYVYFSPTTTGDCYITLANESTTLGHISAWANITVVESNATIVDNEFRVSTSQWSITGTWALSGSGQATITGGNGSSIDQLLTPVYLVGKHYTVFFKLTIPSESLIVELLNFGLATLLVSGTYTASGYYSLSFIAVDDQVRIRFTSLATTAALVVEQVTGGLSVPDQANPSGGSLIGGSTGSAVSESNTGTPCVLSTGIYPSPTYTDIESGLSLPVLDLQQVGVGDFTYCGWLYAEYNASSNVFFLKKGDFADGQILGYVNTDGTISFSISDSGGVTNDYVTTYASINNQWVYWELVRSGTGILIRINGNNASPVTILTQAITSLDTANGFNYIGSFNDYVVTFLTLASSVRFIPSAVTLQRSRSVYALEKDMYKRDERYAIVDRLIELVVEGPTSITSKTTMVGNTIIPDSGKYQETVVNRMDELLQAASKELDHFELISFKAFLTAVVQGGLFNYDAYATSPLNYINNLEVFLVGNSVSPARQGSLEYFIVNWSMRRRGGS